MPRDPDTSSPFRSPPSTPALEPVIRHYAADRAHLARHHSLVVVMRSGVELRGFVIAVGPDAFSFELEGGDRRLAIRYGDVISIFHESSYPTGERPASP